MTKRNKKELILVLGILFLAAFLRFYHLREFIIFLGDEGRDALVVKRMIVDQKWTLLGPTASVGGFYLGPVYYYFMIPFLWLFRLDPVGPAVMVALFGVSSVGLIYWVVREWFGRAAATVSAVLYATAPGIVSASRSSWNPNIMPFFALLSVFSLSVALKSKRALGFILAGAAYGIAIQSHYLGLILGPILAVSTLIHLPRKNLLKAALLEVAGFALGASMFIAFEVRHGFPNTASIVEFISRGGGTTGPRSWNILWLFHEMVRRTYEATFPSIDLLVRMMATLGLVGLALFVVNKARRKERLSAGTKTFLVWLIGGMLGIGFYQGQLYAHYFGFLFPLPFVLTGLALAQMYRKKGTKALAAVAALALAGVNLLTLNIWGTGSNLIDQTKRVAEEVSSVSQEKPFNFALVADGNSDHAYRYFLEIMGDRPATLEEEVTEQLIIVCEHLDSPCSPLGHPLWEIAGFGRAEIAEERIVPPGIRVIRLLHHTDSVDRIGKPAPKGE